MRVVVTADLHYRPSAREAYIEFAEHVQELKPACFIIAGDVGHPLRLFQRALQLFARLDCPRLLIAGNHDVYRGEYDSRTLWESVLPEATRDEGFVWLEQEVITLPLAADDAGWLAASGRDEEHAGGGSQSDPTVRFTDSPRPALLGICGTLGWYDYSSGDPGLNYSTTDYRRLKRLVNHDADYINWPWSDVAMARYLTRGFGERLALLEDDPRVRQVLAVTHMPIFEQAVPRQLENEFWRLLSAYVGNFTLGRLVARASKVSHVVSGHVHRPGHWTVQGEHGPIDFRIVGSQRALPMATVLDFEAPSVLPAAAPSRPSVQPSVAGLDNSRALRHNRLHN